MSIPAGTHRARAIKGSEQKGTTRNGTDQLVIDLDLLDLGEAVSTFLFLSDKAEKYTVERLELLGWKGDWNDFSTIDANEVEVQVAYEEYDGKQQMKVNIVTGSRVKLQPLTRQALNDWSARRGGGSTRTAAPTPTTTSRGTDRDDDRIPF